MTASISTKRTKRSTAIRLSLAGIALVGIGAAATTAAWTDNVFFTATATTSTFNLQGSADGVNFAEGDGVAPSISIPIDATVFQGMTPGDIRETTVTVKNTGLLQATLDAPSVAIAGDLFAVGGLTAAATHTGSSLVLNTNATTTFKVTVTAPANLASTFQGKSGNLTVTISGKSS